MSSDSQPDLTSEPVVLRQRLRDNPQQSLAEEFARHRERLAKIVQFRMAPQLAKRIDFEDVLQESWLAAVQRIGHFIDNESYSMFVWLRLLVGQTLVDLHRHHLGVKMRDAGKEMSIGRSQFSTSASVSIAAQLLGSLTSPSQAVMRDEMGRRLEETIDNMEPIDRDVLVLRHFEELTNSEIAEVLEIGQKAASIRYVRAIRRLKESLKSLPDFQSEARDG